MDIKGKKIFSCRWSVNRIHTIDKLLNEDVNEIIIYDNLRGNKSNLTDALKIPGLKFTMLVVTYFKLIY